MNPDNKDMIERHIYDHKRSRLFFQMIEENKYKNHNEWLMWPSAKNYYNPFNAVELTSIDSLDQLSSFPFIFVRDGFFSLMHFFSRIKMEKSMRTILIIHKNFSAFIPAEWQEYVWFFDFSIDKKAFSFTRQKRRLLIKGNLSSNVASLDYFESCLKRDKKDTR